MRCCCSSAAPAATSFRKLLLSSSIAIGSVLCSCSPPEPQIGGLRLLGSGSGDFAPSRRNLLPLVCLGGNRIRSVANSSTRFSDPQDEMEPINEGQHLLPDQEILSSVRTKIQLRKECQFGEQFFVVGSQPELGLWNPLQASPMTWSDDHLWTAELDLPVGEPIQFKLLLRQVSGDLLWQPGEDRVFHTWETNKIISVFEDWENPEAQQVTEQQESDALKTSTKQLEFSNEKYNAGGETVGIVPDDISHHTKADNPDIDRVMSEGQNRSTPEISGSQVDENAVSCIVTDEVAISGTASMSSEHIHEKVPSLVLGLSPHSTSPTEDVSVEEEHTKVEPHISKAQNPEPTTIRLRFNDELAPSPNNDEDVNGHPDQDLESAFSESQINQGTDLRGDDIKWGQSTLKRFLNSLGFP